MDRDHEHPIHPCLCMGHDMGLNLLTKKIWGFCIQRSHLNMLLKPEKHIKLLIIYLKKVFYILRDVGITKGPRNPSINWMALVKTLIPFVMLMKVIMEKNFSFQIT